MIRRSPYPPEIAGPRMLVRSGGACQGFLDRCGDFDRDETVFGVKVIFAALVDRQRKPQSRFFSFLMLPCSVHVAFPFYLSSAYPVGFVPVQLGHPNCTAAQSDTGNPLDLASAALSVLTFQPGQIPYAAAMSNRFKYRNLTDGFKIHEILLWHDARR